MCRANTNDTVENSKIVAVQNCGRSGCNRDLIIINKTFCQLQLETTFVDIKGRTRPATRRARAHTSTSFAAPPTPPVSWTTERLIVHDTGRGWRGGRRKDTKTSVLGHGHATDDAALLLPAGSDNNCQSLYCFCKLTSLKTD